MRRDDEDTLDIVGCPECGAPAEVVDRFVLHSTDGPVEHLKVLCASRRWFTVPATSLPVGAAAGLEPDREVSKIGDSGPAAARARSRGPDH